MLREDKNVVVEKIVMVRDPQAEGLSPVAEMERRMRQREAALAEKNKHLRAMVQQPAHRRPSLAGLLFAPSTGMKARHAAAAANRAHARYIALLREQTDTERREVARDRERLDQAPRIQVCRLHSRRCFVDLPEDEYVQYSEAQKQSPVLVTTWEGKSWWWYLDRFWWDSEGLAAEDVQALILHREQRKQVTLERARAGLHGKAEAVERSARRREPIPESVRHEVWRRDEGRCVDCGSRDRLEFDHIVPVSEGGSNTARNLELRCESCNRRKAARI